MSREFEVKPFKVDVHDTQLDDLMARLKPTRLPSDFGNDDRRYSYNTAYHDELINYWINDYVWCDVERRMDDLPHFQVDLVGVPLHFIHVKGKGRNLMPLLVHHGWPWTFWDLRKVIGSLTDPESHGGSADDSFDVVLISLPGYGFSLPLTSTGWNFWRTADLENVLMKSVLNYEKYATAGGDWGALIAQQHGYKYSEDLIVLYTHFPAQLSHYLPTHPDQPSVVAYDPLLGLPAVEEYSEDVRSFFRSLQ